MWRAFARLPVPIRQLSSRALALGEGSAVLRSALARIVAFPRFCFDSRLVGMNPTWKDLGRLVSRSGGKAKCIDPSTSRSPPLVIGARNPRKFLPISLAFRPHFAVSRKYRRGPRARAVVARAGVVTALAAGPAQAGRFLFVL